MQGSQNGHGEFAQGQATPAYGSEPAGQRARQRALCVAALPEGDDLSELAELLRTAGVGVVGELHFFLDDIFPNSLGKPISKWGQP